MTGCGVAYRVKETVILLAGHVEGASTFQGAHIKESGVDSKDDLVVWIRP
jgi:hypothetical protein